MYRIGQLNRCIRIERDVRTKDDMGGRDITPWVVAQVYAMYRNKSMRELLQAQQVQSTGTGVFVIRNRNDLLPRDRIIMGSQRFNIVGIPPYDPRASFVEIEVENGVAN
jgi:SPP1 family predicted phage head-tail adaptor